MRFVAAHAGDPRALVVDEQEPGGRQHHGRGVERPGPIREDGRRALALAGIGRPTQFPENTDALITGIPAAEREYMIYLPLRNGVTSLEIGVPKGGTIAPGPPRAAGSKPILFYGTSITHGISRIARRA